MSKRARRSTHAFDEANRDFAGDTGADVLAAPASELGQQPHLYEDEELANILRSGAHESSERAEREMDEIQRGARPNDPEVVDRCARKFSELVHSWALSGREQARRRPSATTTAVQRRDEVVIVPVGTADDADRRLETFDGDSLLEIPDTIYVDPLAIIGSVHPLYRFIASSDIVCTVLRTMSPKMLIPSTRRPRFRTCEQAVLWLMECGMHPRSTRKFKRGPYIALTFQFMKRRDTADEEAEDEKERENSDITVMGTAEMSTYVRDFMRCSVLLKVENVDEREWARTSKLSLCPFLKHFAEREFDSTTKRTQMRQNGAFKLDEGHSTQFVLECFFFSV